MTLTLYTRYPIVARRAWPLGRVRRASKGILHTNITYTIIHNRLCTCLSVLWTLWVTHSKRKRHARDRNLNAQNANGYVTITDYLLYILNTIYSIVASLYAICLHLTRYISHKVWRWLGLYARYLCSRDALGLKAARPSARATIGYLVYNG